MERRRLLENDGYIDWLKSIGCMLYLPLSYNGDLTDCISGQSLILSGNGSIVWDNNEQMYKITQPSQLWQYVARLDNGLNNTWFVNNTYTSCHCVKKITNSSTKYIGTGPAPITNTDSSTSYVFSAMYNASGQSTIFPNRLVNVAYTCEGDDGRTCYQDGEIYNHYSVHAPFLPTNWKQTSNGVAIGLVGHTNRIGTQYYAKKYYVFNTVLDLSIIRKIQGYE